MTTSEYNNLAEDEKAQYITKVVIDAAKLRGIVKSKTTTNIYNIPMTEEDIQSSEEFSDSVIK